MESINFTISEPSNLTSNFTTTDVSCYDADDGTASVNFFGGTPGSLTGDTINYILGWDTLLYYLPTPLTVFNTPIGVPAGIYPYSVTDQNGYIEIQLIFINLKNYLQHFHLATLMVIILIVLTIILVAFQFKFLEVLLLILII